MNTNEKLLAIHLGKIQEIEDQIWAVVDAHMLGVAVGDQLDHLGRIVGEQRDARGDTDYRAAIRLRIRVNRSHGKAEDVIDVARLAAINSTPSYSESYPAAWEVVISNLPGGLQIARLLGEAKAAATYGILTYTPDASLGLRWVNDTDTPVADQLWADDVTPATNYRIDLGAGGT